MKYMTSLLCAAGISLAAFSSAEAADAKIRISDLDWTGPVAIAHILKEVIAGPLKSEVEIVKGLSDQAVIAAGMDKGDGSVDIWTDLWLPNQQALWDKYVVGAKTIGHNDNPYVGTEGIFFPAYLSDKIKSVEDLKKPEIAAMFDKDGNGKGEYWPGDAGWKASKVWQVKFKDYGLSELWEPEIVSMDVLKTQLKTAYDQKKPILFYYWTPESLHAVYDLARIEEPAYTEGCRDLRLDQEDWLEASKFACAHPDATVYVGYSKSLETRNPAVAKFLRQVKFDPKVVNEWIRKLDQDKMDPNDFAEQWVSENMATVNEWIK